MAFKQVPESGERRRCIAHIASEWLQIANPSILARIGREELESLFIGYGYKPYFVEGSEPGVMYWLMAETFDTIIAEIRKIQEDARTNGLNKRPRWPMIILKTPKSWTGQNWRKSRQAASHGFRVYAIPLVLLRLSMITSRLGPIIPLVNH